MRKHLLLAGCGFALLVLAAGCGREVTAPAAGAVDPALLSEVAADPALSAAAGQASLPGLTMEPATTYTGSVSATSQCTYDAQLGRVRCAPVVRNGLTITRSFAFYTTADAAQPKRHA